ncbi:MAG: hypothetical protein WBO10_14305 [Pyrinomonadaceae bacterium]
MGLFGKSSYQQQLEAGVINQEEAARQLEVGRQQQEVAKRQQDDHDERMQRHEETLRVTLKHQQMQDDVLAKALANTEREEKLLDMWESLAARMDVVVRKLEEKI